MKKIIFTICLMVVAIGSAKAQFEKGTWIVNPSVTGLELSHSDIDDTYFGVELKGGAFLLDNVALLVDLGGRWMDNYDRYTVGVSGRYYFDRVGLYTGVGLGLNHWKIGEFDDTDYSVNLEVGYAFFLSKTVTIEPAAFCNLSLTDGDYTKYGLKVGFGFYF